MTKYAPMTPQETIAHAADLYQDLAERHGSECDRDAAKMLQKLAIPAAQPAPPLYDYPLFVSDWLGKHGQYLGYLADMLKDFHNLVAAQPAPGWISAAKELPRDGSDVFAAVEWTTAETGEKAYEIHDCDYYEGGPGSGLQMIFSDCEGNEFEAAEVSFWIYKSDLVKHLPAPPEPAQEPKK